MRKQTEAAKQRAAEYPLRVARDQAERLHAGITAKCEADIDAGIAIGLIRKQDRSLEITRLHIRRMDAVFEVMNKREVKK